MKKMDYFKNLPVEVKKVSSFDDNSNPVIHKHTNPDFKSIFTNENTFEIEENASSGLLKGTRVTNKKTGNSVLFQKAGPYFLEKASERPAVLFLPDYGGTLEWKLKELNKILQLLKEHLK